MVGTTTKGFLFLNFFLVILQIYTVLLANLGFNTDIIVDILTLGKFLRGILG